jgi:cobaltochelatase CobN
MWHEPPAELLAELRRIYVEAEGDIEGRDADG